MSPVKLKGMTWSHPRGYDPMIAAASAWIERTGVEISWSKRSLQDFESYPVEELAKAYDLIVIDHPHVGQITEEACLHPLDVPGRESELQQLARASVGKSFISYNWRGRQWALPIDAAAQVQAWRPDLLAAAPTQWQDIVELARRGAIVWPLRPPHGLMSFFTLAANLGTPCDNDGQEEIIAPEHGVQVLELMRELAAFVDPENFQLDPIGALERLAAGQKEACAPLIYGYVNFAMAGYRANIVRFADIPAAGRSGPVGSALGGTGIAVSAFTKHRREAEDFAFWVAGAEVQANLYHAAGGQPGHASGWESAAANATTSDFYLSTRRTLEAAWLRPRHDGYMDFQQKASELINAALIDGGDPRRVIETLNSEYRASLKRLP
ncbi:extracellular solute-binding protein [Phyllobacterium sp. 0TCS1.6C]|uniref:ABC transporter substrate-binding protein n=1 Tax=unclassified Phyllobacterium TaxID=2638441 RepID=UPI0022647FF8|nr:MULTISPECIES: extracellular solute-binding protein [unclassified Phyllobacterium]MCX8280220.1 extracellular solute-binding protein [Phyllobacterium sp. 0TCS1.6C]MCX8294219.1 extracellular solute-binding protein [Phyllobacterium sp. 0TCS1.6A]